MEKELEELNQRDAKLKASINASQEQIISEERKLKTLQKNIKIDENALVKKEAEMGQTADVFEKLKADEAEDLKAYQDAQKRFEAVNLGLALNDEGEATSLQDQLASKDIETSRKVPSRLNFIRFSCQIENRRFREHHQTERDGAEVLKASARLQRK